MKMTPINDNHTWWRVLCPYSAMGVERMARFPLQGKLHEIIIMILIPGGLKEYRYTETGAEHPTTFLFFS